MKMILTICALLVSAGAALTGEEVSGPKLEMIERPGCRPPETGKRGADCKFNCGNLNARAMWGWRLELPDGSGLAFGGLATWTMQEMNDALQRNDDPCVRTQVRRDGKWVFIHEEFRKKNPLQAHHDRLAGLVRPLKMVTGFNRREAVDGKGRTDNNGPARLAQSTRR